MTAARRVRLDCVTPDIVAAQVAETFASAVKSAHAARRRFRCAVPGGSVASHVLPRIARHELPWSIVDVFLADDRFVAPVPTGRYEPAALDVITFEGSLIKDITAFVTPEMFPRFGLPAELAS